MKEEILAAVMFLVRFIEKSETFPRDQLENFKNILTSLLTQRFEKHWFPDVPAKGQGYRCIRVNGLNPVDMTLEKAAVHCGLSYRDLRLPTELTVWVDPSEVCYRLGESEGSYCTLATFPTSHHQQQVARAVGNRCGLRVARSPPGVTSSVRTRAGLPLPRGPQWQRCEPRPHHHVPLPPHHAPYHYPGAARYMPHHRANAYKNVVTV